MLLINHILPPKMSLLQLLILCIFALSCSATHVDRIVGGEPTTIEKYPVIVQVEFLIDFNLFAQMCAGSVLTRRHILSAAHCYEVGPTSTQRYRIRAGSADRNFGGIVRDVAIILNHPSYGENAFDGDINLLFLETELVYSDVIKQAAIVASGFTVPDNWPITHIGWGMVSYPGDRAPILLEVDVLSVNIDVCRQRYEDMPTAAVTDNMFCTGILDVGGKGPCYGDSGGPVFYDNIVIGVVSWGEGCANKTTPAVNVAVSSYTNWIVENAV